MALSWQIFRICFWWGRWSGPHNQKFWLFSIIKKYFSGHALFVSEDEKHFWIDKILFSTFHLFQKHEMMMVGVICTLTFFWIVNTIILLLLQQKFARSLAKKIFSIQRIILSSISTWFYDTTGDEAFERLTLS